jgi:hypothetical protein
MTVTTGNFQDLVQLSLDTLYHLGPMFEVGNSAASTVTIGASNSAGALAIVASQTGNQTLGLPLGNGTLLSNINISAGTTSSNVSAVTFSNANNVSFGFDGTNVTASVNADALAIGAIAAGTQTATSGTVVFSNSNGVTFGMSGSSRITASVVASINISAGTTSNNLTAVTFSNSNGINFGLNGSVVTAAVGGISSWSNGVPATAMTGGQNTLFFEPMIIPYNITVTNLLWLASVTNHATNSSGGLSVSAALYTLNAGTALSLASSGSTNLTWTSGAALSSNTGINYQQMSVNSWNVTPGPYLFAWWISTQNSATMSYYGPAQQPVISSGQVAAMSNLMLNGYSQATTNALPSSFGLSNTASYIRTGATAAEQPMIIFQGT